MTITPPTKTLRFDPEVLDIIGGMIFTPRDDGTVTAVLSGQLDRPTYDRVAKAIEALGGQWKRNYRAFLFATDPRQAHADLLQCGEIVVEKDGFFETPPAVIERMIELVAPFFAGRALEPSAGMGRLVDALLAGGDITHVTAVERNEQRAAHMAGRYKAEARVTVKQADFLDMVRFGNGYDLVMMNPPFEKGQDIAHVQHAYGLLASGGALVSVMSEGPFFRDDRAAKAFRAWCDDVEAHSEELPAGSFMESGTGVNTRLLFVAKG